MVSKTQTIESLFGKALREVLLALYEQHGSQSEVAQALGVSQSTVSLWMKQEGLQITHSKMINAVSAESSQEKEGG